MIFTLNRRTNKYGSQQSEKAANSITETNRTIKANRKFE